MMKRKAEAEITNQQLIEIIGEDWEDFQKECLQIEQHEERLTKNVWIK